MALKLYRKSTVIKNMAVFLLLSVIYLHIINSLNEGISAFNPARLGVILHNNIVFVILVFLTIISTLKAVKLSKFLFIAVTSVVLYHSFFIFFDKFDKFILVLSFIYLLVAFYFFIFWRLEMNEAIYCPGYNINDIGPKAEHSLSALIEFPDGQTHEGILTNWDESCCFICLTQKIKYVSTPLNITFSIEGNSFQQSGRIVSQYGTGVGIRFETNHQSPYGWKHFFTVLCDRGYVPRMTKDYI